MPIWLLLFFPSWLWLLLVPANYLIDRIVLRWSLGDGTSFFEKAGDAMMFNPYEWFYD